MTSFRFMAVAAALLAATAGAAWAEGYKVGEAVPGTTQMTDEKGKLHKLSEYAGHPVVLEWTNYGCPFTHKQYDSNTMQKLQAAYTAKGVIWLSVISSAEGKQGYLTVAEAPTAIARMGFKGTHVVLDPAGVLGHAFGAETTPHMFIIDKTGRLAYRGAIDSIPSFDAADIASPQNINYVAKALDEMLAGKAVTTAQTRPYGCSIKY